LDYLSTSYPFLAMAYRPFLLPFTQQLPEPPTKPTARRPTQKAEKMVTPQQLARYEAALAKARRKNLGSC
jgi:hypothetical protein